MKKILFLMPTLGKGGAEKVLINLLQKMDYSKYSVDLCVAVNRGVYLNQIPKEVNTYFLLNNFFVSRILTYLQIKFNLHFIYRYLVRKKLKSKYDVAISYSDSAFTDFLFYLPQEPSKRIAWIHASYASYSNYTKFLTEKYKNKLIHNRYSKLDTLVFVSEDAKQDFIKVLGSFQDMRVIYNVLNVEDVIEKADEYQVEMPAKINLVAMGSLLPVKGYDLLLKACALLKEKVDDFHLYILGDGPLKSELEELRNKLGLQSHVTFKGFINNPYPYAKNATIYVMSSYSEALPTALCEAMILGKPVVVTDSNGCREVVANGKYGVMVDINETSLYNGLLKLINDDSERLKYANLSKERSNDFKDEKVLESIDYLFQ